MANESTDKPERAAPPKRPTTIDLKATEIKASSVESENSQPAPAARRGRRNQCGFYSGVCALSGER